MSIRCLGVPTVHSSLAGHASWCRVLCSLGVCAAGWEPYKVAKPNHLLCGSLRAKMGVDFSPSLHCWLVVLFLSCLQVMRLDHSVVEIGKGPPLLLSYGKGQQLDVLVCSLPSLIPRKETNSDAALHFQLKTVLLESFSPTIEQTELWPSCATIRDPHRKPLRSQCKICKPRWDRPN